MLALLIFVATVILVIWRPKGLHEMVPALLGGLATYALGLTGVADVHRIALIVANAAVTIIATFVMSSVLDYSGFFRWMALNLARRAGGSGVRLWVYVLLLSMSMTLFLNNDGSILIATPIICELIKRLRFTREQMTPYILGSALVATASSAPIGVSNPANLEAMALAGFNLTTHTEYMFLPSVLGLGACLALLYLRFRRQIPGGYALEALHGPRPRPGHPPGRGPHHPPPRMPPPVHKVRHRPAPRHPRPHGPRPGAGPGPSDFGQIRDEWLMRLAVAVVIIVRVAFFVASLFEIPTAVVAATGAAVLLLACWARGIATPAMLVRQAPWHILLFAFGMEMVVFALRNVGLVQVAGESVKPLLQESLWAVIILPGLAVGLLACLMNNHPALIVGTLTLVSLELDFIPTKLAYTGIVLGSDILSLLTPIGTLASLLWFHLIRQQGIEFSWGEYLATSVRVIPLSFAAALVGLYLWALLVT